MSNVFTLLGLRDSYSTELIKSLQRSRSSMSLGLSCRDELVVDYGEHRHKSQISSS